MNRLTKKFLTGTAVLLLSLGVGVASQESVHAAVNPARYGIDVFPSRRNHYRFAYQLRRKGHNSRIYYARRSSKIGRALFAHRRPNANYANYMLKHHPRWYRSIVNRLDRTAGQTRRTTQRKRRRAVMHDSRKVIRRGNRKTRRGRRNNSGLLPSRFTRSNNQRALKRSGYFDARSLGGGFIFNRYAPNDRRAVVPKKFNGTNWVKGYFGQSNPPAYQYIIKQHGWRLK